MSEVLEPTTLTADDRVMAAYLKVEEKSDIILNEEQLEAVIGAALVIENGSGSFVIHGLAGTGKTVVMAFLAKMYPDSFVVAPTGKAAMVLTGKMNRLAGTIHSLFYQMVDEVTVDGKRQPVFKYAPKIKEKSNVLLDECSMVDVDQKDDIVKTKATLIAVGDPGQLPPVQREPAFITPNFTLTQIHRQVAGSPIIQQAYRVRNGLPYHDNGDPNFRVIKGFSNITDQDLLDADIILCWRNQTVREINMRVRKLKFGFTNAHANKGEPVMCLRNFAEHNIQNGGIYECLEPYNSVKHSIAIEVDGFHTKVKQADWQIQPEKGRKTSFDLAYACSVHKSQGSEWDRVLLIDDYTMYNDRSKWLYTGITRAAKSIVVVNAR